MSFTVGQVSFASEPSPLPPERLPSPPFSVPVVYMRDKQRRARWDYRVIAVDLRREEPLNEYRLNALGQEGWLLIQVLAGGDNRLDYLFVRGEG